MLYLDYAKQTEDGYIMNFFANSVEDLEDISEGKEFVTKNGTNYGVPAPQSVVTITNKDGEKTTYLMGEDGNWIPGVVNPTDYYTKKQADEKFAGKEEVEEISQNVGTLDEEVTKLQTSKQDKITATTDIRANNIDCSSIVATGITNVNTFQVWADGASTGSDFTRIFFDETAGGATGSIYLCTPTGARPQEDHANIYLPNITSGSCTLATTDDIPAPSKLYRHNIVIDTSARGIHDVIIMQYISVRKAPVTSLSDLRLLISEFNTPQLEIICGGLYTNSSTNIQYQYTSMYQYNDYIYVNHYSSDDTGHSVVSPKKISDTITEV